MVANTNPTACDGGAWQGSGSRLNSAVTNIQSHSSTQADRRLDLFVIRCRDLRDRVLVGSISFIDAIDLAYSAAAWSGLSDDVGDDAVQQVMATAFCDAARGRQR